MDTIGTQATGSQFPAQQEVRGNTRPSLEELIAEYLRRKQEVASLLMHHMDLRAVVKAIRMDDSDESYYDSWLDAINPRRHWREDSTEDGGDAEGKEGAESKSSAA